MKRISSTGWGCAALLALAGLPAVASAQDNLQVLDPNLSRGEIIGVMRGFTAALGLRCSSCHVGEEGQPLSSYDFASDEKVNKVKAREMMIMVRAINESVSALPDRSAGEPLVTCATCHGGARVPRAIEDVVGAVREVDGIDAAVERYTQLREQYFGGRQYDFSRTHLLRMAGDFQRGDDLDAAERFYGLTLELFGNSPEPHLGLGAVAEAREDLDAARAHYRHVLELDPDNAQALARLEALGGGD